MALMFPRLARNFAKNGYYPTDELTLERAIQALSPATGLMCIIDSCAGEGVAIAELAHALGRDQVRAFAVEVDAERAAHARKLVDRCLHSDLSDTIISRQSVGLSWLNPPYGDLVKDDANRHTGKGRARLEKLFYQQTVPLLQYGGIMVLTIPAYTLDQEFVGWITRGFADVTVFRSVDMQFKQVIVFGRRIRSCDQESDSVRATRALLIAIGRGEFQPDEIPSAWSLPRYSVPTSQTEPEHFYRCTLEPEQFSYEVRRLQGLWPSLDTLLGSTQQRPRPPARALSEWHLALALAAGAISGVVRSPTGRVLIVKGDTYKEKSLRTDYEEDSEGAIRETRTLTDIFIPIIRAWDITHGSPTRGKVLTIR